MSVLLSRKGVANRFGKIATIRKKYYACCFSNILKDIKRRKNFIYVG